MSKEKIYKILYRVKIQNMKTEWETLVLDDLYSATISGPELLTTLHWRMGDIAIALKKIESEICKVCEFKLVEITAQEALFNHKEICKKCELEITCFAGLQLEKIFEEDIGKYKCRS